MRKNKGSDIGRGCCAGVLMRILFFLCVLLPVNCWAQSSAVSAKVYRLGFHFWKSANIYDEAYQGIIDSLTLEGINFESIIVNSDLNLEVARDSLRKMDAMHLDCIVSMSSEGTQIAHTLGLKTPLIAAVINHPRALGLTTEGGRAATLTGISYFIEPLKQLNLFLALYPDVRRIGMIYDKHNPAGYLAEAPMMKDGCEAMGVLFSSVGVSGRADLAAGLETLLQDGVEMVIVPTNNNVYRNLDLILDTAYSRQVPVVSLNKQGVENGALAALFADNYKLGRMAGPMLRSILFDGVPAASIPIIFIDQPDLIINLSAANRLNYEFPPEILVSAAIVIQ